ncbi:cyclin-J isoform X2 [Drosophila kikkawai]|uniref:Cyclin-J isoform X2 n=1 Tax=Drosophila kikkawai TaxID=30033 RepID=A0A6P4J2L2_DROKI
MFLSHQEAMANPQAEQNIFVIKGNHENDKEYTEVERLGKTHWQSDYACDIFKSMQELEQRRRPLKYQSPQLKERQETMQLLQDVKRTFKLSRCAFHLAMYYLDRFADHFKIQSDKFALVGLSCLHIAAQIEDTDPFIPRYSEINRSIKGAYTANEYKVVERKILRFFNFEMIRPTTASFVEMFSCTFLTHTDFHDYIRMLDGYERVHYTVPYQRFGSFEQMLTKLAKQLLRLANFTLSLTSFGNVAPSLVAAACIAAVRQMNGVKRWSQYLIDLTNYTEAQVEPYSEKLTMYYYYQITQSPEQVLLPELGNELNICEHSMGPINPNWSSPDSGFEEHSTVLADITETLTAGRDLNEPLTVLKEFVVLEDGTTLEVNRYTSPYRDPEATLKRRRQEDDLESEIQPYKQPKMFG